MNNSTALTAEDKKILKQSYLKGLPAMIATNTVVSQGRSMAFSILPGLQVWYKDRPEQVQKIFERHSKEYYNCHAVFNGYISGVVLAMEKKGAQEGKDISSAVTSVKSALMGPLAGIGDSLISSVLRLVVTGISLSMCLEGSILGPLNFLVFFGGTCWVLKWFLLKLGYTQGTKAVDTAFESGLLPLITGAASILGAVLIGALVASNVTVSIALAPTINGVAVNIQEMLDKYLGEGILSILLFFWVYRRIQKGWSGVKALYVLILICLVCAFFGVM